MAALPSGTVTFLFAAREGSTAPGCDALPRALVEARHGVVFPGAGGSCGAAFASAPDAAATALATQRALQAESGTVRVRMALHTGLAEEQDGAYGGPVYNRGARLLAAAHGGQILLSAATYALLREALPPDAMVRAQGAHRLADLLRAEPLYQLVVPDLPAEFPPLRTLESRPTNLPVQATPLVGRDHELAELGQRLRDPTQRLLTLTGPGGTGKTRLSLHVAAEVLEAFADGVYLVALAAVSEPGLVASAIAQTLQIREVGGQPLLATLSDALREKHLLLVLDNFEQVVAAAGLVADLLAACPGLTVLVSSREPLHVPGEQRYAVAPLPLPAQVATLTVEELTLGYHPWVISATPAHPATLSLRELAQSPAVALFVQRARLVQPTFRLDAQTAPLVAAICARLDGLPLAIELAAPRLKTLSPAALLSQLHSRLTVLRGGARQLDVRQQTLRGLLDWSYMLLSGGEQALFGRLGVFVGGWTVEAAEAICPIADDLPFTMPEGLASLLDKSLLQQEEQLNGDLRYGMLETIREYASYALERLAAPGEAARMRDQHAAYYLDVAEQAEPGLRGPDQGAWLAQLEREHDNLRAALRWAQERGEVATGLRLAGALWRFWHVHGHLSEGRKWLEELLARARSGAGSAPPSVQAKALTGAGVLVYGQGDYGRAATLFEDSLTICRALGDKVGIAGALNNLGNVVLVQGDYPRATALYEESLALRRDLGDKPGVAATLSNLGNVAREQGNYARATALQEESLALLRDLGDKESIARTLDNLGDVALDQGDHGRAAALYTESLALRQTMGDKIGIALGLEGLAAVAGAWGQQERAARLCAAAAMLRDGIGAPLLPVFRATYDRTVATASRVLGAEAFAAVWAAGGAMPLEQVIDEATAATAVVA